MKPMYRPYGAKGLINCSICNEQLSAQSAFYKVLCCCNDAYITFGAFDVLVEKDITGSG